MIPLSVLLNIAAVFLLTLTFNMYSEHATAQFANCDKAEVPFAHCAPNARNFHAVVIAIPGWNGECASTFGKQERSLFKIIHERFYDIDCFDYDSMNISLDKNVDLLRERLSALQKMGYHQTILLTHSTGGIVALRLFSRLFLHNHMLATPQQTAPIQTGHAGDLNIKSLHAYAMPINGHRGNWLATAALRAYYGPETLADLAVGSTYLAQLKADYKALTALMHSGNTLARARLRLPVKFYHGQDQDWVVANIDRSEAENAGWWPYGATLVITDSGHSSNVAEAGSIGAPKFPAEMLQQSVLLELDLLPRLDEIFPKAPSAYSQVMRARQISVVDGVSHFADNHQLLKAGDVLIDFLRRMITDTFLPSPDVANRIMVRFRKSVEDAMLGERTKELVAFCDRIVTEVFKAYETGKGVNITRFGEAQSEVAKTIVLMLAQILRAVRSYRQENPGVEAVVLPNSGSFANFNSTVLNLQGNILLSRYEDAQSLALRTISNSLELYTAEEIDKAEISAIINKYVLSKYKFLQDTDRSNVSNIYRNILTRGPALSDPTFAFLGQAVRWPGGERPLWATVMSNKAVEDVIFSRDPIAPMGAAKFDFLTSVIRETGATGNAVPTSRLAVGEAFQMVFDAHIPDVKQAWQEKLVNAGQASQYPAIKFKVEQAARALQPGRQ